jgi:hypothetical protein
VLRPLDDAFQVAEVPGLPGRDRLAAAPARQLLAARLPTFEPSPFPVEFRAVSAFGTGSACRVGLLQMPST